VSVDSYWYSETGTRLTIRATDDVRLAEVSMFLRGSSDNASYGPWSLWLSWTPNASTFEGNVSGTFQEGYYQVAVRATDDSGREANAALSVWTGFAVDVNPPQARILGTLPSVTGSNFSVGYEVADSLIVDHVVLLASRSADNRTWSPWSEEGNHSVRAASARGTFWVVPEVATGWVRLHVRAMDAAGHESPSSTAGEGIVRVDQVPPDLSLLDFDPDRWFLPTARLGVLVSEASQVEYRFDEGELILLPTSGDVPLEGLSSGEHELHLRATDLDGNSREILVHVRVDGDSPALAWCGEPAVQERTIALCWSALDAHSGIISVELFLDGQRVVSNASASGWSGTVSVGDHMFVLRAVDRAGNAAELSRSVRIGFLGPGVGGVDLPIALLLLPLAVGAGFASFMAFLAWRTRRRS